MCRNINNLACDLFWGVSMKLFATKTCYKPLACVDRFLFQLLCMFTDIDVTDVCLKSVKGQLFAQDISNVIDYIVQMNLIRALVYLSIK